jgi:hypothetical protein
MINYGKSDDPLVVNIVFPSEIAERDFAIESVMESSYGTATPGSVWRELSTVPMFMAPPWRARQREKSLGLLNWLERDTMS